MSIEATKLTINDLLNLDYQTLLELGVQFRNSGHLPEAHAVLNAASHLFSSEWQIWYELGVMHYDNAEFTDAIRCFEKAIKIDGSNIAIKELLGSLYASKGSEDELLSFIASSSLENYESIKSLSVIKEFSDFVKSYDIGYVRRYYLKNIGLEDDFLSEADLLDLFKNAQKSHQGFAFLRLGDGEGAWGYHNAICESKYGSLFERNRKEFWNIWFGHIDPAEYSAFYNTIYNLSRQLGQADVVGVPPLTWVEHEYHFASLRGCSGTFNAVRMAAELTNESVKYCSQLMHYDLGQSENFLDFLSASKEILVVSCHLEMKDFLSEKLNGPKVTVIAVPGEPSRAHLLGEGALKGKHYPEYFSQVNEFILNKDFSGVPVLVAGGILGKQYALNIKKQGGIAIDIGSQADKWMGKKTRPGF